MLCRGDLPRGRGQQPAPLQLLSASCPWPQACLNGNDQAAMRSIHKAHIQGCAEGRCDALVHVCATIQRCELFVLASRLRMWALQSGLSPTLGMDFDDSTLELLGTTQLQEFAANECSGLASAHTLAQAKLVT